MSGVDLFQKVSKVISSVETVEQFSVCYRYTLRAIYTDLHIDYCDKLFDLLNEKRTELKMGGG